jgi:hypothetical protein
MTREDCKLIRTNSCFCFKFLVRDIREQDIGPKLILDRAMEVAEHLANATPADVQMIISAAKRIAAK